MSGFPHGGGGGGGSGTIGTITSTDFTITAPTGPSTNVDGPLKANLAAGGHKITGLANGSAASDAAAFGQIGVGVAFPTFNGSGSPVGVQTATVGQTYMDTTNGALYLYVGTTSGNTAWLNVAGYDPTLSAAGILGNPTATSLIILSGGTGLVTISDPLGLVGSSNGVVWNATGTDGQQSLTIELGSIGQYFWNFNADGSTVVPGVIHGPVLALSANSATPAIDTDSNSVVHITAQTADITSFTSGLTGTPVDGDTLRISITGTAAVALTWGTSFEASTVALPTTTVTTARLDVGFLWNTETSKWRCVAVA